MEPFPGQRLRFSCTSTAQSRCRGLPEAPNLHILPGFIGCSGYNHLALFPSFSALFLPAAREQYFTLSPFAARMQHSQENAGAAARTLSFFGRRDERALTNKLAGSRSSRLPRIASQSALPSAGKWLSA